LTKVGNGAEILELQLNTQLTKNKKFGLQRSKVNLRTSCNSSSENIRRLKFFS